MKITISTNSRVLLIKELSSDNSGSLLADTIDILTYQEPNRNLLCLEDDEIFSFSNYMVKNMEISKDFVYTTRYTDPKVKIEILF